MSGLVPLRRADPSCGTKAATLGRLAEAGFAVPDGIVVRDPAVESWAADLPAALDRLGGARYAVRSSAIGEDSPHASFAGQHLTVLDVPAADVPARVVEVAASGPAAAVYAAATGSAPTRRMAVLVQRMVASAAAGVAFTRHPVTGERVTVVEAVHGGGHRLVSGAATPQRWEHGGQGLTLRSGPDVLTPQQAVAIVEVAERVEGLLGGPQDVEWAVDVDGSVWVLQARPVIGAVARSEGGREETAAGAMPRLATGTAASPGTGRGRLRVLTGLDDFARFRPGEVLVCRSTSPAWTPVLARAAAVITEHGGILSHAAIVARELRIPAVTEVPGATSLPEGRLVVVDGTAGTVTAAEVP